jgi:hypothetical protein
MKGFVFCAAKCRWAKGKNPQNKERTMQPERANPNTAHSVGGLEALQRPLECGLR